MSTSEFLYNINHYFTKKRTFVVLYCHSVCWSLQNRKTTWYFIINLTAKWPKIFFMVKSWVIYILGLCGMSFSHSFLTCMKKTPIFLLQFVLICEGVLCKKKNPYMNCYLLLMLRPDSILTSTIRARFQLFFVEFIFFCCWHAAQSYRSLQLRLTTVACMYIRCIWFIL